MVKELWLKFQFWIRGWPYPDPEEPPKKPNPVEDAIDGAVGDFLCWLIDRIPDDAPKTTEAAEPALQNEPIKKDGFFDRLASRLVAKMTRGWDFRHKAK